MLLFDGITLPLEDPILKFLLILVIILAAPLLLNKLKIPYLLGLIIAGAVIGPHGLNLVLRDSSIILSGTAGLLYIMFLSGLDMDMSDFRKNGTRSLVFGLYTFCVPLLLGILAGYYILGFSIYSSILLAGLFASQTLIAYPIVSKLGIARDKAVTIAVGGTVITDTLALLLLTVIVGMATGQTNWITEIHFTPFNWLGAVLLWIVCGPIALGCLLVAGRNLPAMDYSTIAYWEVPVALFVGLVVYSEPVTLNTAIGIILIVGGGAFPTVKAMIQGSKMEKQQQVAENLSERLAEEAAKEEER